MHLNDGNVIHQPIRPLADNERVLFVETAVSKIDCLETLEADVMQEVLARGDEFIAKLVDALMAPPLPKPGTYPYAYTPVSDEISEYQCRKHKHHGWCQRMDSLAKYTRVAISYHHARKRLRWEGIDKHIKLVCFYGALKSEARSRYYSTDCNCGGLSENQQFVYGIQNMFSKSA